MTDARTGPSAGSSMRLTVTVRDTPLCLPLQPQDGHVTVGDLVRGAVAQRWQRHSGSAQVLAAGGVHMVVSALVWLIAGCVVVLSCCILGSDEQDTLQACAVRLDSGAFLDMDGTVEEQLRDGDHIIVQEQEPEQEHAEVSGRFWIYLCSACKVDSQTDHECGWLPAHRCMHGGWRRTSDMTHTYTHMPCFAGEQQPLPFSALLQDPYLSPYDNELAMR